MAETMKQNEQEGTAAGIVISTRVRLARNLRAFPFPARASLAQKQEIIRQVTDAIHMANGAFSDQIRLLPLEGMGDEAAVSLVERHLVSPDFIADRAGKAVLVNTQESVSVMINEEDHIRLQVMGQGLSLKDTAETADRIDSLLGERLDFAYDEQLGYLTQCPTNLGTGMRASVMLHLPALTENGVMGRVAQDLSRLGLTLRGSYGEGSKIVGSLYQLSNQITLGIAETEAIGNLAAITGQMVRQEQNARLRLAENVAVQDRIDRAVGVLKTARMLSAGELTELLSLVRFGLSVGLVQGMSEQALNTLSINAQPATLMARAGRSMDQTERDVARAEMTRACCEGLSTR